MWRAVETLPIAVRTPLDPERAAQIRDALLARTVPIALWHHGRAEPRATGVFVRTRRGTALLTAAHALDGVGVHDLAVPAAPTGGGWHRLQRAGVRVLAHPDGDVALLDVLDVRLAAGWRVLDAADLLSPLTACADTHVVAGYPAERMRRVDGVLYAKPVVLFTRPHADGPAGRFHYARVAERIDGVSIFAPELDGVSGAVLWAVEPGAAASPADCVLRPAGIQVAFRHDAYLCCEPMSRTRDLLAHALA